MPIKGTYYNATLGAAPTTSGQLGCVLTGTNVPNDTALTSATTKTISTLSSIPPGIWIVTFNFVTYPNGGVTTINNAGIEYNLSTAINTFTPGILTVNSEKTNYINPLAFPSMTGTTCLTITSTTTYYLNITMAFVGDVRVSTINAYFKAIRVG